MIDTGKVVARSPPVKGPWEAQPWELMPYSQHDLQAAVNGFDNLVLGIESLLENPHIQPKDNPDDQVKLLELVAAKFDIPRTPSEFGLVSREVLDSSGIGEGFVRDFLTSVRRPKRNIKFVAPGLRIPTAEDFSPHPLQNFEMPGGLNLGNPLPLFISSIKSTTPTLDYPFNDISNLPCGLWTNVIDRNGHNEFEDACRLYLPFEIGANGFARLADDSLIGEDREGKGVARPSGRRNDLYQLGYNHYVPAHGPQLGDMLDIWKTLVGTGEWEVGEEGVRGGIEKFKEADTDEHYYKYQLFVKW
jgi:hypothetical protein